MIIVNQAVLSDDIAERFFVCDLIKCKGACCVEGDAGAPLTLEEALILEVEAENIRPFLSEAGIREIERVGTSEEDKDGDLVTPTIMGKECAYAVYNEKGILLCGIENAYNQGKTHFKKPISCHLYPIRIAKYEHYEALNYDRWHICNPACANGMDLGVPIYVFLKDALIRKYGIDWYNRLCAIVEERNNYV